MKAVLTVIRAGLRQLARDWKAGELKVLAASLVLAVTALAAVSSVSDRAGRALASESSRLVGGDLVLASAAPFSAGVEQVLAQQPLDRAATIRLVSMARGPSSARLVQIRAIGSGYPLRGQFAALSDGNARLALAGRPQSGTVWLSAAAATQLDASVGERIELGEASFGVAAILASEPDVGLDFASIAPRLYIALDDLAATKLVVEGSRISYRDVLAGSPAQVSAAVAALQPALRSGESVEKVSEARPEVRAALDRAGRFLGLAALTAGFLSAVALALSAHRHMRRQLDSCAIQRCLGASQARIVGTQLVALGALGIAACLAGVVVGWLLQAGVSMWLASRFDLTVPAASPMPFVVAFAAGFALLPGFALPQVMKLRNVPALFVLRRDALPERRDALLVSAAALVTMGLIAFWLAGDVQLALIVVGGLASISVVLAGLGWALVWLIGRSRSGFRGAARYGLAQVTRRAGASIAQIAALGIGLSAVLLLTVVHADLLSRWRADLGENAPDTFLAGIQPGDLNPVVDFLQARQIDAEIAPIVRARYERLNGADVEQGDGGAPGSRGRRLTQREFNLTDAVTDLPPGRSDNRRIAGRDFGAPRSEGIGEMSVEAGLAEAIGWKLGDRIGFRVGERPVTLEIVSLREVDWDSFQPNFFVTVRLGDLADSSRSYIAAFRRGDDAEGRLARDLSASFPGISLIDIRAVLAEVRGIADRVATAVSAVFWFTLLAGVLVLIAAINASQDERLAEAAVMRALGATRAQLRAAQLGEFITLGALAGVTAAIFAAVIGAVVADRVFNLEFRPDFGLLAVGTLAGIAATVLAGLGAVRRAVAVAPVVVLRELRR